MTKRMTPYAMGALMGAMMLWVVHGLLTGQSALAGPALLVFVLAHVAVAATLLTGTLFLARLSPRARGWLSRLHRPSGAHVLAMLAGMIGSSVAIHLSIHGGLI